MSNMSFTLQTRSAFNVQTIVDSVIYRIDKKRVDELYTAIPKVKTVFEDLNAILLSKLLKRNIERSGTTMLQRFRHKGWLR